jgi:hypothetical protein
MELRLIGAVLALALLAGCSRTTCRCSVAAPVAQADTLWTEDVPMQALEYNTMRPEELEWLRRTYGVPDSAGAHHGH